jgi:hypothetical protein
VLFLIGEDDFNAVAELTAGREAREHLFRLAPSHPEHGIIAPHITGPYLFGDGLGAPAIGARLGAGASFVAGDPGAPAPADADLLFVHRADGGLAATATAGRPAIEPGDRGVWLTAACA